MREAAIEPRLDGLWKDRGVKPVNEDRYGRTLAWVYWDGVCLNKELLRARLAWHYKRHSEDKEPAVLEEKTGVQRTGLWSDSEENVKGAKGLNLKTRWENERVR